MIGQELLAYSDNNTKTDLYYWHRDVRGSQAEIDYLINDTSNRILPIEVKSSKGGHLKSLRYFLDHHQNIPYGIRFSTQNYSVYDSIHSYPLYAAVGLFKDNDLLKSFITAQ